MSRATLPPGGIGAPNWAAVLGGIATWIVHLVALAALAPAVCDQPGVRWWIHGLTAGLGGLTVVAVLACARLARAADPGSAGRRSRFLGSFGVTVAATALVLILAEGAYAVAFDICP